MDISILSEHYDAVIADLGVSEFAKSRKLSIQKQPYHLDEIQAVASLLPQNGRLLDIGTGLGILPETFHRIGFDVVGIDTADDERGREPLKRLIDQGIEGHYARVGPEKIPLKDNSVDVVFAGDVIEHLPGTPRYFLREIYRVLKSGGRIVLTTPNSVRLAVRIRVALGHSNWPPVRLYLEDPPEQIFHVSHHHEYTDDELKEVIRDVGFHDIRIDYIEDTLKRPKIFGSFSDIKSQNRFGPSYWTGKRLAKGLSPFELARLTGLGFVSLFPRFRSILIAIGQKPSD